jgi:hypothetical protein
VHRWLDLCLRLPVGASERTLDAALTGFNPVMSLPSRRRALSEMRLCIHPTVRANLGTLTAFAAKYEEPGTRRYVAIFLTGARAIRDGRRL